MILLLVFSADSALGKIDKHFLSDQTLLELLTEAIENREKLGLWGEPPNDISEWINLWFNDERQIIKINWSFQQIAGFVDLKWLPMATENLDISWNQLKGSVDLTCLPDVLLNLNLSHNQFFGTIDLTKLPGGIQRLLLHQNEFHGDPGFGHLPDCLIYLNISNTSLEGEVHTFGGELIACDLYVDDMRTK